MKLKMEWRAERKAAIRKSKDSSCWEASHVDLGEITVSVAGSNPAHSNWAERKS
jgi:hypothetical protein